MIMHVIRQMRYRIHRSFDRMRHFPWRVALFSASLAVGCLLLVVLITFQITSQPRFCGSCHFMRPYYESWKMSAHNTVPCVECHIPPGFTSEIRKKYEAFSMVVSYLTGTYRTSPWAEIDDAACLQCHKRRLLRGRIVFRGIRFDHSPHMLEMRRGKRLRCTFCHAQIVQGEHITVNLSTCFLCHFKDQPPGQSTARCLLCHEVPEKIITKAHLSFRHGDVRRFNMRCTWCHARVVRGQGEAPRDRCLTCHNDPKSLNRYPETELLHQIHITERKVDCLNCHMEIRHGAPDTTETVATACTTCHINGHTVQRDLYAGIGGKGVPSQPSGMYLAGIQCVGCHFMPQETGAAQVLNAGAISCMACHGPRYRKIYLQWKAAIDRALRQVDRALDAVRNVVRDPTRLRDIEFNVAFVRRGRGMHNPTYALALLRWSYAQIQQILQSAGRPVPAEWRPIPYQSPCLHCHIGIEWQETEFRGRTFRHAPHVLDAELTCTTCHGTHPDSGHVKTTVRSDTDCDTCHHRTTTRPCATCHGTGPREIRTAGGRMFPHALHAGPELAFACDECHMTGGERPDPAICTDCHD